MATLFELIQQWEQVEPEACIYLRHHVDKSMVFYTVATNRTWRAHLKSTNMLERFFRELKRYEKSRQCRFASKRSCERFYYAFAKDYNDRYPNMPKPRSVKTKRLRGSPSLHFLKQGDTGGGHPQEKSLSRVKAVIESLEDEP